MRILNIANGNWFRFRSIDRRLLLFHSFRRRSAKNERFDNYIENHVKLDKLG